MLPHLIAPMFQRSALQDVHVVTATDQAFIRGAYTMIWTLLRANNVHVVCYDLGIDDFDLHLNDLERWGVDIRPAPGRIVGKQVEGWQTFNKPTYIRDAMHYAPRVLWLDADIAVRDSLTHVVNKINRTPFVPGHHDKKMNNRNRNPYFVHMPQPHRDWKPGEYPCAGLIGLDSRRDVKMVEQWLKLTERLSRKPWLYDLVRNFDQGIFQDIIDVTLADPNIWNCFRAPRDLDVAGTLSYVYQKQHPIIHHFAGPEKPWLNGRWPDVLDWGQPFL